MTDEIDTALTPLSEAEVAELGGLKSEMGDTRGRHFNGPWQAHYWSNEIKQSRARDLMAREDVARPAAVERADDLAGDDAADAGPDLEAISAATGLSAEAASLAVDVADQFEAALGADASAVNSMVAGLPPTLKAAIIGELGRPYVSNQTGATGTDLTLFCATETGAILGDKWGGNLPTRLGAALARISRLEASLSEGDYQKWKTLWHSLAPAHRAALVDILTA